MSRIQKLMEPYLGELDNDPYHVPPGQSISLLLKLVSVYLWGNLTSFEREETLSAIEVLITNGVDPLKIEEDGIDIMTSPIKRARDNDKELYELMMNWALISPIANESVAFENKFTDALNKIPGGFKNAVNRAAQGLSQVATLPTRAVGTITGQNKKLKEAKQIADSAPSETKEPEEMPGNLQTDYDSLSTPSEKELFILENLPTEINSTSRGILAKALVKENKPFSSDLYKVIEAADGDISEEVSKLLVNPKFSGLTKSLAQVGLKGIDGLDSEKGLQQLKIIAFFALKGWNTANLRVRGANQWKTLSGMTTVVNQIDLRDKRPPEWKKISPKDVQTYLKKLTGQDVGEVENVKALQNVFGQFKLNLDLKKVTLPKLRAFRKYPDGTNIYKIMQNEKRRLEK